MATKMVGAPKGSHNSPATEFKKGERSSPSTEFKKGLVPHNKGTGVMTACKMCGKAYQPSIAGKIYCSKRCQAVDPAWRARISASKVGKPNPWLKGRSPTEETRRRISAAKRGISPEQWDGYSGTSRHREMGGFRYKEWRAAVFTRDGYACRDCGRGGYLHADHVVGWAKDVMLRYDVANGRTLCYRCHFKKTFGCFDEEKALTWGVPKQFRNPSALARPRELEAVT